MEAPTFHGVCKECGRRWERVGWSGGPRQCKTPGCEAQWLDLPEFFTKADADAAAEKFASERVAVMREP